MLTGGRLEHRYVANRLCAALPVLAVVVDERVRTPSLRRAFRGGVTRGLSRICLHAFRKAVRDAEAREKSVRRILGEELTTSFPDGTPLIHVDGINSPQALAAVRDLRPDALAVFGTGIVGVEMLGLATELSFNLHTGISPRYRGTDCAFWPIANREPEWIGATVHECTADVDGGQIFGSARAPYRRGDTVHDIFGRAVARGADLYVETLRRYVSEGGITGEPQDLGEGREYRGYMRTLWPELRARWALRRGLAAAETSVAPDAL
jgi:methionyl-tRNA formyltransferase